MACNKENFYGTYVLDDIVYLSSLSSVSYDYIKSHDTKFILNKNYFKVESSDNTLEINNATYKKEKMSKDLVNRFNRAVFNSISLSKFDVKYQYTIYDSNDEPVNFRIYLLDNTIWLSAYHNKAENEYELMNIYKLKDAK